MEGFEILASVLFRLVVPFVAALVIAYRIGRRKFWLWIPIAAAVLVTLVVWVLNVASAQFAGEAAHAIVLASRSIGGGVGFVLVVFVVALAIAGPKRALTGETT